MLFTHVIFFLKSGVNQISELWTHLGANCLYYLLNIFVFKDKMKRTKWKTENQERPTDWNKTRALFYLNKKSTGRLRYCTVRNDWLGVDSAAFQAPLFKLCWLAVAGANASTSTSTDGASAAAAAATTTTATSSGSTSVQGSPEKGKRKGERQGQRIRGWGSFALRLLLCQCKWKKDISIDKGSIKNR